MEMLIDILKLSTIYLIPDLRRWSILELGNTSIPHALRYYLAVKYRVSSWLDKALTSLVHMPLLRISSADIQLIGHDIFELVAKVKERIAYERKLLAIKSPTFHHSTSCTYPDRCKQVWSETWWNQVAPQILHFDPDKELQLKDIPNIVQSLELKGMTPECRAGLDAVLIIGLQREERLVNSMVQSHRIALQADEWSL